MLLPGYQRWLRRGWLLVLLSAGWVGAADEGAFFESRVRPVLVEHCYPCHSAAAESLKASLRVDSREGLLRGGDSGPAVIPGDPSGSLLLKAVGYEDPDLQMPPRTRLSDEVVAHLRRWIAEGAAWPEVGPGAAPVETPRQGFDLVGRRQEHWAWQPVHRPKVPETGDPQWARGPLDRLVYDRLQEAGLRPARRASKGVWIRRVTFALTGLPPTPEEVEAFLTDGSTGAEVRVVDRLLASPHFGERWARHWLDKVRYAETMGHEFDYPIPGAWRYRDYVIRAFNADVPYDQFAREQIAGDLLDNPRRNPADGANESRLGTAQYWFCQQVHSPVDVRYQQSEVIDNQIDVVGKAFLGLTIACARCHDHKFDAISTRDYYALYGVLASSRFGLRAVDDPAPREQEAERLRGLRGKVRFAMADALLQRDAARPSGEAIAEGPARLRTGERRVDLEGGWADGEAFEADPKPDGQPVPLGNDRWALVRPGWRHSGSLSRRFQGAWRSSTFAIDQRFLHLRLSGQGARFTLAVEGFTLVRDPIYGSLRRAVERVDPHWVTLDLSMWQGRQAWLEIADFSEPDPASTLPATASAADGWVAVGEIILSANAEPPPLETAGPPRAWDEVLRVWRSSPGALTSPEVAWLAAVLRQAPVELPGDLAKDWDRAQAEVSAPTLAGLMADGTGIDEPVFLRGNHRRTGEWVARRFLEAISAGPEPSAYREGSGRLALAQAVTSPENPLFARVMVNWVWAHLFGRGLVGSVDNFGVLGERPTHPELLDWLAEEFRTEGWSVKRLIRRIVLSETFAMSSRIADADERAARVDPGNALFHRARLRRLEGEAIRDALLAVSGRLDPALGGPSVPVHLTPFMDGRGRPGRSGPLDGEGRRSVYLEVRRNFLSPLMLAFDLPLPSTTVGLRSVSNVPAQALAMMNDPFVEAMARHWSDRLQREEPGDARARLKRMYVLALGRAPTATEQSLALEYLGTADGSEAVTGGPTADRSRWTSLCQVLINTKEFIFLE